MRFVAAIHVVLATCAVVGACSTDNGAAVAPDRVPSSSGEKPPTESKPAFDASIPADPDAGSAGDGGTCSDPDDPGSAENVARVLAPTDDCDNDYKTANGIVASEVDVDMYKLSAEDNVTCLLDTDFATETQGIELCVFVRCKNSTVDAVTGCEQGAQATSDLGRKGCCTTGAGHAIPNWDCSGFIGNQSADILLRVKAAGAAACLPYSFTYRF